MSTLIYPHNGLLRKLNFDNWIIINQDLTTVSHHWFPGTLNLDWIVPISANSWSLCPDPEFLRTLNFQNWTVYKGHSTTLSPHGLVELQILKIVPIWNNRWLMHVITNGSWETEILKIRPILTGRWSMHVPTPWKPEFWKLHPHWLLDTTCMP